MVKHEGIGTKEWQLFHEVLFENSPEGKRAKWEYIKKNMPEIAKFILQVNEVFGKPSEVRIYRG
jgi:hypothetical protein